jgi:hypothetical protein
MIKKKNELKLLQDRHVNDLWEQDLAEFLEALAKVELKEQSDACGAVKNESSNKHIVSKSVVKQA